MPRSMRARARDRDPAKPGEYERNLRLGAQDVFFRVLPSGDIAALFINVRSRQRPNLSLVYQFDRGKTFEESGTFIRETRRPRTDEEIDRANALRLHLADDHGYIVRPR